MNCFCWMRTNSFCTMREITTPVTAQRPPGAPGNGASLSGSPCYMFPYFHDDFGVRSMDTPGPFWVHPALHVEPDRMESPGTWCGPRCPCPSQTRHAPCPGRLTYEHQPPDLRKGRCSCVLSRWWVLQSSRKGMEGQA